MAKLDNAKLDQACRLMDDFAARTGLTDETRAADRYLWTDALAVQCFFALAQSLSQPHYHHLALKLIEQVHNTLGRYHPQDARQGWLSGLPEAKAREHPTAAGLRIGKKQLERQVGEPFDERLEWERDGQYFHYLIPWAHALLSAAKLTEQNHYSRWAAELLAASEKFLDSSGGRLRMYWKMSVDLSRPQVRSTGAHDPLTGFICVQQAKESAPEAAPELNSLNDSLRLLCTGRNWATSDSLGIGGLLLDTLRASKVKPTEQWPESVRPESLLEDALLSLEEFYRLHSPSVAPQYRLAFRECGLSLGLRALAGAAPPSVAPSLQLDRLGEYLPLAGQIEDFWLEPINQRPTTWTDHLNINAVTLAASLVAEQRPGAFAC